MFRAELKHMKQIVGKPELCVILYQDKGMVTKYYSMIDYTALARRRLILNKGEKL